MIVAVMVMLLLRLQECGRNAKDTKRISSGETDLSWNPKACDYTDMTIRARVILWKIPRRNVLSLFQHVLPTTTTAWTKRNIWIGGMPMIPPKPMGMVVLGRKTVSDRRGKEDYVVDEVR